MLGPLQDVQASDSGADTAEICERQRVHSGLGGRLPNSEEAPTPLNLDSYRGSSTVADCIRRPSPRVFSNSPTSDIGIEAL
jgi:hypothetical protein